MKVISAGYMIFLGLVIEIEKNGQKAYRIIDYCKPGQIPFIGATVIRIHPETKENFQVKNDSGPVQFYKRNRGCWKFLSSEKTMVITTVDEETGRGYEFTASLQKNGSYIELSVSESRLFASEVVTVEQLTQALINAVEKDRKRHAPLNSESLQNLIQTFKDRRVQATNNPVVTHEGGKGRNGDGHFGGYFKEVFNQAKAEEIATS